MINVEYFFVFAVIHGGETDEEREDFGNESRQILGDFTFVLVHNLSELGFGSFFPPPPVFKPQM